MRTLLHRAPKALVIPLSVLAVVALCATLVLAALFDEGGDIGDLFSHDLYASIMAGQAEWVADIVADFECRQLTFLPIVMPSPEYVHVQSGGILAFDPARFPKEFLDGLVGVEEGAITRYPITVHEDPRTRERIILNTRNERIGGQYAPRDYDPQWYVKQQYPGLPEMDPEAARRLIAIYDPSRIVVTYDLMLEEDVVRHVFKQSIDAAARAGKGGAGGGGMRSGWEGGPVSNLQFTAIDWETNGTMTVTLAYPWEHTNDAFEVFTCDGPRGLIDDWWDPGTITNADASTNWISWNDTGVDRSYGDVRYYVAAVSNDVDGDGASDGFERYVSHTGATDSNSYPVCVSGTISYSGILTGPVRMVAVTGSNEWVGAMVSIPSPGTYANDRVGVGTSYWFKAYRDSDEDRICDYWEAQGAYASNPVEVTDDVSGVDISLSNPADDSDSDDLPDWWEMHYFGDLDEGPGDDEPDSDGLVNSNEYAEGTDPTDGDTDDDGMGDWAETMHGNSPTTSNAYSRLPYFEGFELYQRLLGSSAATNVGYSVDMQDGLVIAGACDTQGITNSLAYVFNWNGTNWIQQAELSPWMGSLGDMFGCSVAISSNRAIVGASGDSTNGASSGAAYVFVWTGTTWSNEVKLAAHDGASGDRYGSAVAISGNAIAIGAPADDVYDADSGSVYIYRWNGTTWTNNPTKLADPGWHDSFGCDVDFSPDGQILAIGEHSHGTSAFGAANVLRWDGTNWTDKIKLTASDIHRHYRFGRSVALTDDLLLVGSPGHDGSWKTDSGAAYIFQASATNWSWTEIQYMKPSSLAAYDRFGHDVALSSNILVVGAPRTDAPGAVDAGALYVYERTASNWVQTAKLRRFLASPNGQLGQSVALVGDTVLGGAHGWATPEYSGSACAVSVTDDVPRLVQDVPLLDNHRGWDASPCEWATIVTNPVQSGYMAARLGRAFTPVKSTHFFAAAGETNIWIDAYVRVAPSNVILSAAAPVASGFPNWVASLYAVNSDGELLAYDGSGSGSWLTASNAAVTATNYHRYTVKQDYTGKTWDLYFDGTRVLHDLGFSSDAIVEFSGFALQGKWCDDTYLDSLRIGFSPPGGISE